MNPKSNVIVRAVQRTGRSGNVGAFIYLLVDTKELNQIT